MTLQDAVKGRRSIRKYKPDAVPRSLLQEILETARWSPSWGNTQPWEFYVLTGKPLAEFKKANRQKMSDGEAFSPDVPMPGVWPEAMKKRYMEVGKSVLEALAIKREDKDARDGYSLDMAFLFDAPCLIVACIHKDSLVEYAMLDVGLVTQTICLVAHDRGLGTCIMAFAVGHPAILKEILSIPEDRRVIVGIALGYPEPDFPLNRFERKRAELSEFVKWVG